jgi:hypothetical protein
MKKCVMAALLICASFCLVAHADQGLINMPCAEITDYRQDLLFRFTVDVTVGFKSAVKDFERLGANATPEQTNGALLTMKFFALDVQKDEDKFVKFYFTHRFPPKADAVIAPVVKFIQSDAFRQEEKALPKDIEHGDFAQLKALYDHYVKIPFPQGQQMEVYIDEAVYGGNPPPGRR